MKMKNKIISVLIVSLLFISMTVSAAGGCGHWVCTGVGKAHCVHEPCDGENGAFIQPRYMVRTCVRPDNTVYDETDFVVDVLGCGC